MPLRRLLLLSLAVVAILGTTVAAAIGLRQARSASSGFTAPLTHAPWSQAPSLSLGVLTTGVVAGPAGRIWAQAARDRTVRLDELRGVPVVVNFWASWCVPCRLEAPVLRRAWSRAGGKILFLGVNQNDSAGRARQFVRDFGVTYPSLAEDGDTTAARWDVRGFPVSYFVAADGRVAARYIGQLRAGQLDRGITAAVTGRYTP